MKDCFPSGKVERIDPFDVGGERVRDKCSGSCFFSKWIDEGSSIISSLLCWVTRPILDSFFRASPVCDMEERRRESVS